MRLSSASLLPWLAMGASPSAAPWQTPLTASCQQCVNARAARASVDASSRVHHNERHGYYTERSSPRPRPRPRRGALVPRYAMNGFTPLASTLGGVLIWFAAILLLATTGRLAGISGVVG